MPGGDKGRVWLKKKCQCSHYLCSHGVVLKCPKQTSPIPHSVEMLLMLLQYLLIKLFLVP